MLRFLRCGSCLKVSGSGLESQGVADGDVLRLESAKMFAGDLVVAVALHGSVRRNVGRLRFSNANQAGIYVGNCFHLKEHVTLYRVAAIRPARTRKAA